MHTCPFISVIVPVYNVEEYLRECLDSILSQTVSLEIIAINDGSTDGSDIILQEYEFRYSLLKVIRQENKGLSAARNRGMQEARGKYLLFLDSDDRLVENSLSLLYQEAESTEVDLLMGNMMHLLPDGTLTNPYKLISDQYTGKVYTGEQCFVYLMRENAYLPMACLNLYRREWIKENGFLFHPVTHEDELWTPVVMCHASRVKMIRNYFYHYRQREGSITNGNRIERAVKDRCYVCNQLSEFASGYSWNNEIKGWILINMYRLYANAFFYLSYIKYSGFALPSHQLYEFFRIYKYLTPQQKRCGREFYRIAHNMLHDFLKWRLSPFFIEDVKMLKNKMLILIYNTLWNSPLKIPIEQIPEDVKITTDRSCFDKADVVIFHLPDLMREMKEDVDKNQGQIWVAWNMECEHHYPWIKEAHIRELFDIYMDYHPGSDIVYPYYSYDYQHKLLHSQLSENRNNICMLISSHLNQSKRIQYLKELMEYIPIDSYGGLFRNMSLEDDKGRETQAELYRKYKFVIAFENALHDDYVTEKFYHPLLAGAVPVYLGAPNIEEFAPGDNCFVDVRKFKDPLELAVYLKECLNDKKKYDGYHHWRQKPLREEFIKKTKAVQVNPFIRLIDKIKEIKNN